MAVANFHEANGHYPQPYLANDASQPTQSWRVSILPYIEQQSLLDIYRRNEPWNSPGNRELALRMPRIYALHGDYKLGYTTANYVGIVGSQTVWRPGKPVKNGDIMDGLSNTLLIVENRGLKVHWMEPRDLEFDTMDWSVNSPRGISSKYDSPGVVFLDGTVRRLSKKLTPEALRAMATIAGGDAAGDDGELIPIMPDGRDRPVTKP